MKFIAVFLYYFLATFTTVVLTLIIVSAAIDFLFWVFFEMNFDFSMKDVVNFLKIASITGVVCGVGGVFYSFRKMKRH